jgi:putative oxidoreductase
MLAPFTARVYLIPEMRMVIAVLSVALALLFLFAGSSKLFSPIMHARDFQDWGYPHWFIYVVGGIEVAGALLLLAPFVRYSAKLRLYGALLLAVDMIGATATHLKAGQMDRFTLPLTLCVLCLVVAYGVRSSGRAETIS